MAHTLYLHDGSPDYGAHLYNLSITELSSCIDMLDERIAGDIRAMVASHLTNQGIGGTGEYWMINGLLWKLFVVPNGDPRTRALHIGLLPIDPTQQNRTKVSTVAINGFGTYRTVVIEFPNARVLKFSQLERSIVQLVKGAYEALRIAFVRTFIKQEHELLNNLTEILDHALIELNLPRLVGQHYYTVTALGPQRSESHPFRFYINSRSIEGVTHFLIADQHDLLSPFDILINIFTLTKEDEGYDAFCAGHLCYTVDLNRCMKVDPGQHAFHASQKIMFADDKLSFTYLPEARDCLLAVNYARSVREPMERAIALAAPRLQAQLDRNISEQNAIRRLIRKGRERYGQERGWKLAELVFTKGLGEMAEGVTKGLGYLLRHTSGA